MAPSKDLRRDRARRRRRSTPSIVATIASSDPTPEIIAPIGGVSASAQAGNITLSDTPLPLRAEIDPAILANWSPPPPQPTPQRPTFVIEGGAASPPFPPVEVHVAVRPETVPADDIIYPPTVTYTEPPKRRQSRPKPKTKIGRAVETNRAPLALAATTFLALVEERLLALRLEHDRLNSDDGKELAAAQIADYEDLKQRIKRFLQEFSARTSDEGKIVEATTSFAEGVRNWWNRDHVSICNRAFDRISFSAALGVCLLAGAGGQLSVIAATSLVVGKPFTKALSAWAKAFAGKK
jgi:hypothetical protein